MSLHMELGQEEKAVGTANAFGGPPHDQPYDTTVRFDVGKMKMCVDRVLFA